MQETVADELETAYKGRIWAPELRHVKSQRQGIKAARVEIQTFTGDAKVRLTHLAQISCAGFAWQIKYAPSESVCCTVQCERVTPTHILSL